MSFKHKGRQQKNISTPEFDATIYALDPDTAKLMIQAYQDTITEVIQEFSDNFGELFKQEQSDKSIIQEDKLVIENFSDLMPILNKLWPFIVRRLTESINIGNHIIAISCGVEIEDIVDSRLSIGAYISLLKEIYDFNISQVSMLFEKMKSDEKKMMQDTKKSPGKITSIK